MRIIALILLVCLSLTLPVWNSASAELKQLPSGVIKGSNENPKIIKITNPLINAKTKTVTKPTLLKMNKNIETLEIYPYQVDTKEIVEELKIFRYQYAWVWVGLMGVCFYLVLNKSTYW